MRDAQPGGIMCISSALVAQPDRASDYESEGRRFESCRARPSNSSICRSFSCSSAFGSANLSGSDRNVTGVGRSGRAIRSPEKRLSDGLRGLLQEVTQKIQRSRPGEGRLKGVRGHQDISLDTLLEAAILEQVAGALASGREVMDAKQAADFLRISESGFKRMASRLPRNAVTERRYIYLRSELLAWLLGR